MITIFDFEPFRYFAEAILKKLCIPEEEKPFIIFTLFIVVILLIIRWRSQRWRKKQLDEILKDYGEYRTLQQRWLFIKTWFQIKPPHDLAEPYDSQSRFLRTNSIDFFINSVFKKNNQNPPYYCILGGSGMGKSTFVVQLITKYIEKYKEKTIPYPIKLLYCGELIEGNNTLINRIEKIENKENTILILDALDENNEAIDNYSVFYKKLLTHITDFRIVVITCRTQFFEKYEDEPNKLPIRKPNTKRQLEFEKYYISPLKDKEVIHYLNKKYPLPFSSKRKKAKAIVDNCKKLMARPLLLSYLDDLLKSDIENRKASIVQIYDILINKWLEREAFFAVSNNKEEYKKTLLEFSTDLAICMTQPSYRKEEIDDIIGRYKDKRIIKEQNLKGRSLLNRNSKNDFKFAHKSFMEFLAAKEWAKKEEIPLESIDCVSNDMIPIFLSYMIGIRVPNNCGYDLHLSDYLLVVKEKVTNFTTDIYIDYDVFQRIEKYLSAFISTNSIRRPINLHINYRYNYNTIADWFNTFLQGTIPLGEKTNYLKILDGEEIRLPELLFHYNYLGDININFVQLLEKLTRYYESFTIVTDFDLDLAIIKEWNYWIFNRIKDLDSKVWIQKNDGSEKNIKALL